MVRTRPCDLLADDFATGARESSLRVRAPHVADRALLRPSHRRVTVTGMETHHLTHSVSSTREYRRCPRRYRFAYVDREPARRHVPVAWRVGSAVHAALEAAYRHRQVRGGDGPMTDCLPAATASLHLAWDDLDLDGAASLAASLDTVRRFLRSERVRGEDIVGVEQRLAATTADGVRIAGYADLVLRDRDTIEIHDHKTSQLRNSSSGLSDLVVDLG